MNIHVFVTHRFLKNLWLLTREVATSLQWHIDGLCTYEQSIVASTLTIYFLSSSANRPLERLVSVLSRKTGMGKGSGICK